VPQCQSPRAASCSPSETFFRSTNPSVLGKRAPESDFGQPGSIPTVPPAIPVVEGPAPDRPLVDIEPTDDGPRTDDTVVTDLEDDVNADTCSFARVVDVVTPFLPESQSQLPLMLMIPSTILDGSAPRIMATVRSHEFPVILDSGAEVSVFPAEVVQFFQPPIQLPATIQEVRTFGPSSAIL